MAQKTNYGACMFGISDIVQTIEFDTSKDYFEYIDPLKKDHNFRNYIYRGHSSNLYKLIPTALRRNNIDRISKIANNYTDNSEEQENEIRQISNEYLVLRHFFNIADRKGLWIPNVDIIRRNIVKDFDLDFIKNYIESAKKNSLWPKEEFYEITGLCQHYGLPTRLLDWSTNIYKATYFAVIDLLKGMQLPDGTERMDIWALNCSLINIFNNFENIIPIIFSRPQYSYNENLKAQEGLFTLWAENIKQGITLDEFISRKTDRRSLDEQLFEYLTSNPEISDQLNKDINKIFICYTIPISEAKNIYQSLQKSVFQRANCFQDIEG